MAGTDFVWTDWGDMQFPKPAQYRFRIMQPDGTWSDWTPWCNEDNVQFQHRQPENGDAN